MYHWHLHEVKGQQNYNWLRNMFYEIVQQTVQWSSVYYLAYVVLCSDHNHCIILYSYYTKYQEKMNKTFFWHIDLNIPRLVKNHKKISLIQKSVLLDSEWKNNCMKMLLDMQNHLSDWWKNVQARLQARDRTASDGLIHQITHHKWTKKDIMKYDLDFKLQLCCKNQIQVSLLHLLHEAQSSKDIHWTVLSWYIEITVNHKTLNISESSTWSELFAAHQDLISESSSLSFLHNLFSTLPYSFSAVIQVTELRSISDALIDWLHWMNSVVIWDLQILLGENDNLQSQYIAVWQNETRWVICEKWKQIEYLEQIIFDNKFFFYCWKHNLSHPHSDNPSLNFLNNEMSTVADSESDRSANHYWCLWECSIELGEKICCEADWLMIAIDFVYLIF